MDLNYLSILDEEDFVAVWFLGLLPVADEWRSGELGNHKWREETLILDTGKVPTVVVRHVTRNVTIAQGLTDFELPGK